MTKKIIGIMAWLLLTIIAVPALAVTTDSGTTTNQPNQAAIISCMSVAVSAREAAIQSAFNAYSSAETAALTARQSALQTAWSKTAIKEIRTAVNAAWKAYRTAHRAAAKTHNTAVKAAWQQFKQSAKDCKPTKGIPTENQSAGDNAVQ